MKYWRGYIVAAIFAAITIALVAFANAHSVLVDMVYPYMTRIVISTLADWSSGVSFCIWNAVILALIAATVVAIMMILILRWNPIQMTGWALAVIMFLGMCTTVVYGLNDYTGPLSEDVRLEVAEYTVSGLNDAAVYFRDQANKLAGEISRDGKGRAELPKFEALAKQAGDGFKTLAYQDAISIYAGSTAPVKKMNLIGTLSKTMPLTGESAVDPGTPDLGQPFVMCMEMARRMSISDYEEAKFSAFLACKSNSSVEFQYVGYLTAYAYCYNALADIPTSTAQTCAAQTKEGNNPILERDLPVISDVIKDLPKAKTNAPDAADLLTCWYIQEFVTPLSKVEEKPFDPLDSTQVDLKYTEPAVSELKKN